VHISELANHHVENPREVVQPGDDVKVKILEIETERRRLSLSVKRVEGQILPRRTEGPQAVPEGPGDLDDVPELGLSEDVFSGAPAARAEEPDAPAELEADAPGDPALEEAAADTAPEATAAAEPEASAPAAEPEASAPAADDSAPEADADAAPEAPAAEDAEPEAAAHPAAARDDEA
jgi:small subunit ribosomal protein S1